MRAHGGCSATTLRSTRTTFTQSSRLYVAPLCPALLAGDLPANMWPEVYKAMRHIQNIVPSSALQRGLKKKEMERREQVKKVDAAEAGGGEGKPAPWEQGEAGAKAAAASTGPPVRDMISWGPSRALSLVTRRHEEVEDSHGRTASLRGEWGGGEGGWGG